LSHGCPPAVVRAVPADREATVEVAGELLAGADRCDGFVCRSVPIAEGVAAAVTAAGMSPQTDVGIVACDFYGKSGQRPPFPCDMPTVDMEEIGRRIGRLLARQARGELDTAAHEEIPLSLEFPPNFGD